ncbi:MAG: hypothetical protein P8L83_07255 [Flavobacteriaceae bacterium]|nr:hypothetical protein [Flavobacteriaceae bacterium]
MSEIKNEFLPEYLIADNSKHPECIYVVHTEYPRFILNVSNDNIFWLEEFSKEDENEILNSSESLINSALKFYDSEIRRIK